MAWVALYAITGTTNRLGSTSSGNGCGCDQLAVKRMIEEGQIEGGRQLTTRDDDWFVYADQIERREYHEQTVK